MNESGIQQAVSKKVEQWTSNCLKTLNSAHSILSVLTKDLGVDEDIAQQETPDSCSKLENKPVAELCKHFVLKCQEIIEALCTPVGNVLKFPLGSILKLVVRCLRISHQDVCSLPSMKELSNLLPSLYEAAMTTLTYLIWSCGTNLLPHSCLVLDLLQQVLEWSHNMNSVEKSLVRGGIYQVLIVWLKMAGMGRHFKSKLPFFIQELDSDIQCLDYSQEASKCDIQSSEKHSRAMGKGKKKKRKNFATDSYLDLSLQDVNDKEDQQCKEEETQHILSALDLTAAILERGKFMQLQKFVRSLLNMASTLQRSSCLTSSPYNKAAFRLKLYKAVWISTSISLENGVDASETVAHFQLTNQALSIMSHGCISESMAEVQIFCQDHSYILHSYRNLVRPILRKNLPNDSDNLPDCTEMTLELEKLKEQNESQRKKIVELEVEKHTQSRLAFSLKQEINELKVSLQKSTPNNVEESLVDGKDEEITNGMTVQENDDVDLESDEDNIMNEEETSKSADISFSEEEKKVSIRSKRTIESEVDVPIKKQKQEEVSNSDSLPEQDSNEVNEMLLDFVDADADD